jgi:hypothetical protein
VKTTYLRLSSTWLLLVSLLGPTFPAVACPKVDPAQLASICVFPTGHVDSDGKLTQTAQDAADILEKQNAATQVKTNNDFIQAPAKLGKAYIEMIKKHDDFPNLSQDSVQKEIETNLPALGTRFLKPTQENSALLCHYYEGIFKNHFAKTLFPQIPSEHLTLVPPSTPPGSGAIVYLVKNEQSGAIVAAFKMQGGLNGLREVATFSASNQLLDERVHGLEYVKALAAGKMPDGDYFLVQSGAEGKDINRIIKENLSSGKKINSVLGDVDHLAAFLVKMHTQMNSKQTMTDRTIEKLKMAAHYNIQSLSQNVLHEVDGDIAYIEQLNEVDPDVLKDLRKKIKSTRDEYESLVKGKEAKYLEPTYTHADAHGGNFFATPKGTVIMIDYGTMMWSAGDKAGHGTGDPGNDLGRMMGSLQFEAVKNGATTEEAVSLSKNFLTMYKTKMGISPGSERDKALNTSTEFYRNRFLSLIIPETGQYKTSPKSSPTHNSHNPNLRKKLFNVWRSGSVN